MYTRFEIKTQISFTFVFTSKSSDAQKSTHTWQPWQRRVRERRKLFYSSFERTPGGTSDTPLCRIYWDSSSTEWVPQAKRTQWNATDVKQIGASRNPITASCLPTCVHGAVAMLQFIAVHGQVPCHNCTATFPHTRTHPYSMLWKRRIISLSARGGSSFLFFFVKIYTRHLKVTWSHFHGNAHCTKETRQWHDTRSCEEVFVICIEFCYWQKKRQTAQL